MNEDLSTADLIIGIKPISPEKVLEGKTYMMYSRIAT